MIGFRQGQAVHHNKHPHTALPPAAARSRAMLLLLRIPNPGSKASPASGLLRKWNGAAVGPRRRRGKAEDQALNELLLPVGVASGLNSLARPFSTRVLQSMSCRPCLRRVQPAIMKPMQMMKALRNLAR